MKGKRTEMTTRRPGNAKLRCSSTEAWRLGSVTQMLLLLTLTIFQFSCRDERTTPAAISDPPRPEFPLDVFAGGQGFNGEDTIALSRDDKRKLRGALAVLEKVLPKHDPRRVILWSTPMTFVESHGRDDVAARWDANTESVEIGRRGFVNGIQLVVTLGHEFTHALNDKTTATDVHTLLRSEKRAYESELPVIRSLMPFVKGMTEIPGSDRDYFVLDLKRLERSCRLLLRMANLRLDMISLAYNIRQVREQCAALGFHEQHLRFLDGNEAALARICLADRPIKPSDCFQLESVLRAMGQYLRQNRNFKGEGVSAILGQISRLQDDLSDLRQASRSLAAVEKRLRESLLKTTEN